MIPDVTVIVPAYNSLPYVTTCMESVLAQSIGLDRMELIVVDDGSTDGTGEELDRFAARWDGMRVIHTENSGGPSAPRNIALDLAQGRYVFVLDADDSLGVEALERMVAMADEQGTDVVIGRYESVGGRGVPQSMFKSTQPKTNVFESRAWWTFNPMKLYRRELIERLGLRYAPIDVMEFGEDQPFTATMYLNASGISIIADYTCVYWTLRDDGQNMISLVKLKGQMECLEVMMALVPAHVPPGRNRDHLLQRLFELEVMAAVQAVRVEEDARSKADAFERIAQWVDDLYNMDIGMRLRPYHRIVYELMGRRRIEDVFTVIDVEDSGQERVPIVADDLVFDPYPYFRTADIPDECYDITSRIHGRGHLESLDWDGGVLIMRGRARLDRISSSKTDAVVVIRKRGFETAYEIPTAISGAAMSVGDDSCDDLPGDCFEARLDVTSCADGASLDRGLWDLYVRLEAGSLSREARIGLHRDAVGDSSLTPTLVHGMGDRTDLVVPYHTKEFGNLTLDVGGIRHSVELRIGKVVWGRSSRSSIEITAEIDARVSSEQAVQLVLRGPNGAVFRIPMRAEFAHGVSRLTGLVVPGRAAGGSSLPDGDWRVAIAIDSCGTYQEMEIPAEGGSHIVRWWQGIRPMHLESIETDDDVLVLRVGRAGRKSALRL